MVLHPNQSAGFVGEDTFKLSLEGVVEHGFKCRTGF
jgi:hypothetical protein